MAEVLPLSALLVMFVTALGSLGALLVLFDRHIGGQPLLRYEPRKRVPWQAGIVMLVMVLTFSGVIYTLIGPESDPHALSENELLEGESISEATGEDPQEPPADQSDDSKQATAKEFVVDSLGTTLFLILLVVVIGFWLHVSVGADEADLGLPSNRRQMFQDMRIGGVACLAALMPIYLVQIALTLLLQPEVEHPIVEQLVESHSPAMLLAAIMLVVIAAPVGEEFVFRLLLQGWLERWEDEQIDYEGSEPNYLALLVCPQEVPQVPKRGALNALPHGWLPILISGTMFGLAHLGHGVSPVPLVLFGIVLGYLYQRTHRLVPSLTAHALFNAYSMIMLWLQLGD